MNGFNATLNIRTDNGRNVITFSADLGPLPTEIPVIPNRKRRNRSYYRHQARRKKVLLLKFQSYHLPEKVNLLTNESEVPSSTTDQVVDDADALETVPTDISYGDIPLSDKDIELGDGVSAIMTMLSKSTNEYSSAPSLEMCPEPIEFSESSLQQRQECAITNQEDEDDSLDRPISELSDKEYSKFLDEVRSILGIKDRPGINPP